MVIDYLCLYHAGVSIRIRKAVIPAAGLGTRLYPLTRAQPKEMLPIVDKPVIHRVVDEAIRAGLDQILIIVGKSKNSIIDYFDTSVFDKTTKESAAWFEKMPSIYFVRQREQKGLGDAITYARDFVGNEDFVVLLGDTIYMTSSDKTITEQTIDVYENYKAPVVAVESVPKERISSFGIIKGTKIGDRVWRMEDVVEKPKIEKAPSNLSIAGTYVLKPDIFRYLDKITPSVGGEYQLTDALKLMCDEQKLLAYEIMGKRYDIGTTELWMKAFMDFAKKDGRFDHVIG
jgi:UTP--glucose-1-phosphate uridylyltransferase